MVSAIIDDPGDGRGEASSGLGAPDTRLLSACRASSRVGVLGAGVVLLACNARVGGHLRVHFRRGCDTVGVPAVRHLYTRIDQL